MKKLIEITQNFFLKNLKIQLNILFFDFAQVGFRANELESVVKVLIDMMESYNLSLEDLSETFQPDESIYIAEFINSLGNLRFRL